jgi:hypothetical protein
MRTGNQGDLEARRKMSAKCAVDLTSSMHTALLDFCGPRSRRVPDVLEHPGFERFGLQNVERAVQQLVAKRFLSAVLAEPVHVEHDESRRYRFTSKLNQTIFEEQITSTEPVYLASRILGGSIDIPEPVRVRLFAFLGGNLADIWRVFSDRITQQTPGSRAAPLELFQERITASLPGFVANELPYLLRFGMLEEDA